MNPLILIFGHRWQEAIIVANSRNHPDVESLQNRHYEWLLQTGQA
jgi:hypothetical protein